MAFPVVASTATYQSDSTTGTTRPVTLPSGIGAGDLLIVAYRPHSTATATTPDGWGLLGSRTDTGTTYVWGRVADGSEGATLTVTNSAAVRVSANAYRITGHGGLDRVTIGFAGSNINNPPELLASWGGNFNLFLAGLTNRRSDSTVTAAPGGYSGLLTVTQASSTQVTRNRVSTARRELLAADDDPGAFTTSGTIDSPHSFTLVIGPPAPASDILAFTGDTTEVGEPEFSNILNFEGETLGPDELVAESITAGVPVLGSPDADSDVGEFSNILSFTGLTDLDFGILSVTGDYIPGETVTLNVTGITGQYQITADGVALVDTGDDITDGDGTIDVLAARGVSRYGAPVLIEISQGQELNGITVTMLPEPGLLYVNLDILADAEDRITAVPDLESGFQLAWFDVLGGTVADVTVFDDATFEIEGDVYAFSAIAHDGSTWRVPGAQDLRVLLDAADLTTPAPVLGVPTILQAEQIVAQGIVAGAPVLTAPSISQRHVSAPVGLVLGAPVVGEPDISQLHVMGGASLVPDAPVLGASAVTQEHALTTANVVTGEPEFSSPTATEDDSTLLAENVVAGAPILGNPALTLGQELISSDIVAGAPVLSAPAVGQLHRMFAGGIVVQVPALPTATLSQTHVLGAQSITTGAPVLGSPGEDNSGRYLQIRRIEVIPALGVGKVTLKPLI